MSLTNILTDYDVTNSRTDIKWLPFIGLLAIGIAARLLMGDQSGTQLLQLLVTVVLFAAVSAVALLRLGASRLSAALVTTLLLLATGSYGSDQMAALTVFSLLALGCMEYFKFPAKGLAVGVGAVVAVLAAGMGDKGVLLVALLVVAVWLRTAWHLVVERLGKKRLALFVIKACMASVVGPGIFLLLNGRYTFPWADVPFITSLTDAWLLWLVVGLLALRGLWATLLLRTARSPKYRALRLFFVAFGVGVLVLVAMAHAVSDDLFLPNVVGWLDRHGFTVISAEAAVFLAYGVALLASAGIDRFLYKDTMEARKFRAAEAEALALAEHRQ